MLLTFVHYIALAVAFLIGYILGIVAGWFERGHYNAESDD